MLRPNHEATLIGILTEEVGEGTRIDNIDRVRPIFRLRCARQAR